MFFPGLNVVTLLCNHLKIQGIKSELHNSHGEKLLKSRFPEDSKMQMLDQQQQCFGK